MRFPFSIALSASFVTALLAEWPDGSLFDFSDSLEEPSSSYPTDGSLQDLFQPPPVTTDSPEDGSPLALGCTSSSSDELMRRAKIRRREGICPSPIFSGDTDGFNLERLLRGRIQEIQDRAQRERRVLPFCPPPTMALCCIGEPEYLGVQVHDCQLYNPLIWTCLDLINIFCCTSYGSYMNTAVDIRTGLSTNNEVYYGSLCIRVFGLPMMD